MKTWIAGLALGAALTALAPVASATVLDFEGIGLGGAVPQGYGGLDWSAGGWSYYEGENAPYTPQSGISRAALGWYDDADAAAGQASSAIRFSAPSRFDGAYFAGLGGSTVQFDMYFEGTLVGSSGVLDPSASPSFLSSGYVGLVDRVVLRGPALYAATMDDFTFTTAVPEPASAVLMLAGIAAMTGIARRRAKAQPTDL